MPKQSELGKRVKEFRMGRQMSQKRAAAYFGISESTIIRLETGTGSCLDLTRAKIEKILAESLAA